jgi:hypothetical protein
VYSFSFSTFFPASARAGARQVPAVPFRQQAKAETDARSGDGSRDDWPVQFMAGDDKCRPSQGRDGVEIAPEHDGCPGDKQIACNASADAGQHPQQRRHQRVQSKGKSLLGAGDGKERKTRCSEYQYRGAPAREQGIKEEGQQPGGESNREIPPVSDRGGWDGANQQVTRDTSRTRCHEGQDENSEDIEIAAYAQHRAADREDKGAGKVENQQEIVDRPLLEDGDQQGHFLLRR